MDSEKRRVQISPSMMCADIADLCAALRVFEENGVDYLHIDVMDGVFVPNLQLGTGYVRQLRKLTGIPLDVHMMIDKPEDKTGWFDFQAGEYVSVHVESTRHLQRALRRIRDTGARTMAALNPATPLSALDWVWDDLDAVLIMTVNPGYAGQQLVPQTLRKITECREHAAAAGKPGIEIEVDGNVNLENAVKMASAGADIFVLGSSCLFVQGQSLEYGLETFRNTLM